MTYELAIKLKDAGWNLRVISVEEVKLHGLLDDNTNKQILLGENGWSKAPDSLGYYLVPTLSELIEACGDKLESLNKIISVSYGVENGWRVRDDNGTIHSQYDTPEDAVANLWLAIHTPLNVLNTFRTPLNHL